ncbi:MAG: tripartite tricarboxylate transporter family receptor [Hyphomicrobiales bacterium]|jgi:tripartite-type tricarboxylate transporter receptor subunit TctC|nr:tripartite tricarboxylate transporter family receptor [Hyphomicrobiales bacterium]
MLQRTAAKLVMGILLATYAAAAHAQSDSTFYKNKTIRLIVGFSPGGGYDANARLLARFIGAHIPGSPNIVVENMPGASSLKSVQYLETAPKDGTVMVAFNAGLVIQSQVDPANFRIKLTDYSWIGSIGQEIRMCYLRAETGVKTFAQLQQQPNLSFGETGVGSAGYIDQGIMRIILGVKLKTILGYPGSADKALAVARGELDGDCASYTSVPPDWIQNNKINMIYRSTLPIMPGMPADLPYIMDLAKTQQDRSLIKLLLSPNIIGRPYMASKDIPKDRLALLRNAFSTTLKDPEFTAAATSANLTMIGPMTGDEATAYIAQLYSFGPDVIAEAKTITGVH